MRNVEPPSSNRCAEFAKRIRSLSVAALFRALRLRRIENQMQRADRFRNGGNHGSAAASYRHILRLDSTRVEARIQLANMLKELTEFNAAEAVYRQALVQRPDDSEIYLQLGHLLKLLGRTEEAHTFYSTASRLHTAGYAEGESWDIGAVTDHHARLAAEYIRQGDRQRDRLRPAEAVLAYEKALALDPGLIGIRVQHGNMLKDSGRLGEAELAYRAALVQGGDDAEVYLQLGHVLKLQGRRNEALDAYRLAVKLRPSFDAAWTELFSLGPGEFEHDEFTVRVARGGLETLLGTTDEITRFQRTATRLSEFLPSIRAQTAFPISSYDTLRTILDVPAPYGVPSIARFSVIMVANGLPLDGIRRITTAIQEQSYDEWNLYVIGRDPEHARLMQSASISDRRVSWVEAREDESNTQAEHRIALTMISTEWLVLPRYGAVFHKHALRWLAVALRESAAPAYVMDEETLEHSGDSARRFAPRLRPVVDYDTLLEYNPYGDTVAISRAEYEECAKLIKTASLKSARRSLLLNVAYHASVGIIPLPLVAGITGVESEHDDLEPVVESDASTVASHLDDVASAAVIVPASHPGGGDAICWRAPDPQKTIQVIIPTRDNGSDVKDLIDSLYSRAAVPDAICILVINNGSTQAETIQILAALSSSGRAEVITINEPFNWSRLNNLAAAETSADLLLFLNDDMLMTTPGWDRYLRGLLARPEIGAVGARLAYPGHTIQHAGILLGMPEIDAHDGRNEQVSEPGPGRRWHVTRAVSAATGAFLAVTREMFQMVGGFDQANFPIGYGDIDFALKIRALDRKILWTPHITLLHFESKTRGVDVLDPEKQARDLSERQRMRARWGEALDVDPGMNPTWHPGPRPFRLLWSPSEKRVLRYIRLCARRNPWHIDAAAGEFVAGGMLP